MCESTPRNDKNGQRFASVPVAVFFTRDFVELYRYVEYPAIYHKDRVIGHLRAARSGESEAEAKTRGGRDIATLLDFHVLGPRRHRRNPQRPPRTPASRAEA